MAYFVAERTHEIGIRMALGAARAEILKAVLKRGATLAVLAFAIGVPSAIVLARLLAGLVYGTAPLDPVAFVGVPAFLGAVCLLACYIPARRATKVDPIMALRHE